MKVIKPYFGKFQPDLYFLEEVPVGSTLKINVENMNKQDVLKDYKDIDPDLAIQLMLISGTIRFSIKGIYFEEDDKRWFEVTNDGNHLLTCVWWKDTQKGIDDYMNKGLYFYRTFSSSKTSGYDYIVTELE